MRKVGFGLRQLLGHPERRTARKDGDLRHRVGVLRQDGDERVTSLVDSNRALISGG